MNVTQHLAVEVQGANLAQLIIRFSTDVNLLTALQVTDQAGALVGTKVAINQQQSVISFVKPVLLHTTLKVNLKGVRRTTTENVVAYEMAARQTGVDGSNRRCMGKNIWFGATVMKKRGKESEIPCLLLTVVQYDWLTLISNWTGA